MTLCQMSSGEGATFSHQSETGKPYNVKETNKKINSQGECNLITFPPCQKPELHLPQGSSGTGNARCIKKWAQFGRWPFASQRDPFQEEKGPV